MKQRLKTRIVCTLLFIASLLACAPESDYITISGYAQGGTYTVKINLVGKDGRIEMDPEVIADSVDIILRKIDSSVSGYNRNSLLSRFNAGEDIVPDEIFNDLFAKAWQSYELSDGAVDASAAPLFDIWGFGFKNDSLPSEQKVATAKEVSGMNLYMPELKDNIPAKNGLKLNFNAFAQGYSCDLVALWLKSIGVKDMMVDIGEIYCQGLNPSGKNWTMGIDKPVDGNNTLGAELQGIFRVPESGCGVVTSGNYRKFYIRDGRKYAHTIDPRTGYPVEHSLLSATIVAPDAFLADTYATYCMVIGLEESKKMIAANDELEGCLIYDDAGVLSTWTSEGFLLEPL